MMSLSDTLFDIAGLLPGIAELVEPGLGGDEEAKAVLHKVDALLEALAKLIPAPVQPPPPVLSEKDVQSMQISEQLKAVRDRVKFSVTATPQSGWG